MLKNDYKSFIILGEFKNNVYEVELRITSWEASILIGFCAMASDEVIGIEGHGIGRLGVWFQIWEGDSLMK